MSKHNCYVGCKIHDQSPDRGPVVFMWWCETAGMGGVKSGPTKEEHLSDCLERGRASLDSRNPVSHMHTSLIDRREWENLKKDSDEEMNKAIECAAEMEIVLRRDLTALRGELENANRARNLADSARQLTLDRMEKLKNELKFVRLVKEELDTHLTREIATHDKLRARLMTLTIKYERRADKLEAAPSDRAWLDEAESLRHIGNDIRTALLRDGGE